MFFSNDTIAHNDLELRAATQDANLHRAGHTDPLHIQKTRVYRSIQTSLMALALLSGAVIFGMQMASPAFAEETNADAKLQKQKSERVIANPNTYVLKHRQGKADTKASDAAILEKKKRDYDRLVNSVKALTDALKRESEKAGVNNAETFAKVESNSKEATRFATAGAYDKAQETLERGYHILTAEVVKLENLKGQGGKAVSATAAKPDAVATDPRDAVEHEIKTNKALVDALRRQNEDKVGGKDNEIDSIIATAVQARTALDAGDVKLAGDLIHDANSRTKLAIASLQKTPNMLAGSEALSAAHRQGDDAASEANLRNSYAKRKENVAALLEAGRRIDTENSTSHAEFAKAESMLQEAEVLAAANKFAEGKAQLDRTYLMIKDTMRNMLSLKEPKAASKSPATKTKKQREKTRADAQ